MGVRVCMTKINQHVIHLVIQSEGGGQTRRVVRLAGFEVEDRVMRRDLHDCVQVVGCARFLARGCAPLAAPRDPLKWFESVTGSPEWIQWCVRSVRSVNIAAMHYFAGPDGARVAVTMFGVAQD